MAQTEAQSGLLAGGRRMLFLVAAVALVPGIVKLLCYPANIGSDDAYIHLQIAHNFVNGLGWGINPHEPVNLSTSPAFTLLLAGIEAVVPHGTVVAAQLLSALAVVAGLVLIFQTVRAETGSAPAALFAEVAAAFSVNLWRWNGSLMEASFAFAVVALTLFLCRTDAPVELAHRVMTGLVLGLGVLLRPEFGIVVVLAVLVRCLRAERGGRLGAVLAVTAGAASVVIPWCLFAAHYAGSVIPTTFAAKSTSGLQLVNRVILNQMAETWAESILFPTLLVALLLVLLRSKSTQRGLGVQGLKFVLPVGWVLGLVGFYYLKTPELQSPGRYVLPLLPAEVMVLALLWAGMETRLASWKRPLTAIFLSMHAVFALAINFRFVTPVLRRFEGEYGDTMRAAAEELAARTEANANRDVLVEEDIGVLGYSGRGRFEISDGGALATPSLRGLSFPEQLSRVHPALVVQSLASNPDGLAAEYPGLLTPVWKRRFRQHGVGGNTPYYYAIIFRPSQPAPAP